MTILSRETEVGTPSASIVTVARTMAPGGEQVALQVALQLGYRYVDEDIVLEAARAAGVTPDVIEEVEHVDISGLMQHVRSRGRASHVAPPPEAVVESIADYGDLLKRVIVDIANEGGAVIVAHGAGLHLAGRLDTLRVLVTGSVEDRAARHAERNQIPLAEARAAITASDTERTKFLETFYARELELPTDYDLVLNTDRVSIPAAARAVVAAAANPA